MRARRGLKMADMLRELLEREFPKSWITVSRTSRSTGKRQRRPGPGSDGSGPCRGRCRAARGGRVPSGLAFPVSAIAVAAKLMGETLDKLEADLVAPIDERR